MSNPEKRQIPEAPALAAPSGNLLSSVAPPAELPNFITATAAPATQSILQSVPVQAAMLPKPVATSETDKFSPAIPFSKGEPTLPIRSPEEPPSPVSLPDDTADVDKLGDIMPGSGLLTWVRGAVPPGLLQRVAERARTSVDAMITTLDPQMKDYLNSGGDITVVVVSDKDVKISPIREAFQAVFGKASVTGIASQSDVTAEQPVGYASAYAAAKQRIAHVRSSAPGVTNNTPLVAIEGFLHEAMPDRWYELNLLVLSQPSLGIEVQAQAQGTPAPAACVAALRAGTPPDYEHRGSGLRGALGRVMADNLQVPHTQWQEATTGVSRREILVLAARSLAGSYKRLLAVSAAES